MRPAKPLLIGLTVVGTLGAVLVSSAFGGGGAVRATASQFRPANGMVSSSHPLTTGRLTIVIHPQGPRLKHAVPSNFAVEPGVPLRLTFVNHTANMHTFTIPKLGISVLIRPGSESTPRVTRVTLKVNQYGVFSWYCVFCVKAHPDGVPMWGTVYAIIGAGR